MSDRLARLRLVSTPGSNFFMAELLELVAAAARDLGADARVVADFSEDAPDTVFVTIPHEFYGTAAPQERPDRGRLVRTIALCTEQPGTVWFERSVERLAPMGAVMDIQTVGITELRRRGLAVEHLQLGYHESWDGWHRDPACERPVDVLFVGSADRRRDQLLASYAPTLWPHHAHIVFAAHEAKPQAGPGILAGDEKRRIVASAKIMLAPRRSPRPYFEWARALDAILGGAVLVCEHGAGFAPLVPGEHFLPGAAPSLALLAAGLLDDPGRIEDLRTSAYDTVRDALPMTAGAARLLDVAAGLLDRPAPARPLDPPPEPDPPPPAGDAPKQDRSAEKKQALQGIVERRAREHREALERGVAEPLATITAAETPAFADATPRVSVLIPAYRHAAEAVEALVSIAASDYRDLEVLIHDDASGDDTPEVVEAFLAARPWLPARLTTAAVNAGLPHTRNRLAEAARGEFLLILDADNEVWPTAIGRLVAALDADPQAGFAYPILQMHRDGQPHGLLSYTAWDPSVLARRNPIDAFALIRAALLQELGGYTEDVRMLGWEDYDLWCRVAAAGGHGVQVPQILARYRMGESSMLSLTDIDVSAMRAVLRERYPTVMGADPYP